MTVYVPVTGKLPTTRLPALIHCVPLGLKTLILAVYEEEYELSTTPCPASPVNVWVAVPPAEILPDVVVPLVRACACVAKKNSTQKKKFPAKRFMNIPTF